MSAVLDYSGGALGGTTIFCKANLCQAESERGQTVSKDCTQFLGTDREQRTTSHFVYTGIKCMYRWRKRRPELKGICKNVTGVSNVKNVT